MYFGIMAKLAGEEGLWWIGARVEDKREFHKYYFGGRSAEHRTLDEGSEDITIMARVRCLWIFWKWREVWRPSQCQGDNRRQQTFPPDVDPLLGFPRSGA